MILSLGEHWPWQCEATEGDSGLIVRQGRSQGACSGVPPWLNLQLRPLPSPPPHSPSRSRSWGSHFHPRISRKPFMKARWWQGEGIFHSDSLGPLNRFAACTAPLEIWAYAFCILLYPSSNICRFDFLYQF
jgi:hypothetical protein